MGGRRVRYVVVPAEDIGGEWVSVCLDIGLVSQGPSPEAAIESLLDSIIIGATALPARLRKFAKAAKESKLRSHPLASSLANRSYGRIRLH